MMRSYLPVAGGSRIFLLCIVSASLTGVTISAYRYLYRYYNLDIKMPDPQPNVDPRKSISNTLSAANQADLFNFDHRRRLANKLAKIQLDIAQRKVSGTGVVDGNWSLELSQVVAELDPRSYIFTESTSKEWDFSARLPNMGPAPRTTPDGHQRHVCPEIFKFSKKNHPYYQKGMMPENCTYVPKFHKILTVLLISNSRNGHDLSTSAKSISKHYDIHIIGLVKNASLFNNSNPNKLTYIEYQHSESDSEALSRAVKSINTPFVLFGNSLNQFNTLSSLERLVRVLDELPLVKVAAGAARDSQGRWIHGCLQQKMENYYATYDIGYYSSKYECMYCDDILTPFVTYTDIFKKVPFTKGLNGSLVFHDWFVRLRYEGHLSVTCPDVMFYVSEHPSMTTSDWKRFAQIYSLVKIKTYDSTVLNFSCSEVKLSCKGIWGLVSSFLIPPCCLEIIQEEMSYILDFADQSNIHYELQAGSILGAIKMGRHMPWDLDMDFEIACDDFGTWMKIKKKLSKRNCQLGILDANRYFTIICPVLSYDFICQSYIKHNLSRVFLPEEFVNNQTKINFGGRWTSAISNPGLYSRNKFGMNDLRHAVHSKHQNKKGTEIGQLYNPGSWNKCEKPNHHACIDNFPVDGSLPFANY